VNGILTVKRNAPFMEYHIENDINDDAISILEMPLPSFSIYSPVFEVGTVPLSK
jgi:hypothetical protein